MEGIPIFPRLKWLKWFRYFSTTVKLNFGTMKYQIIVTWTISFSDNCPIDISACGVEILQKFVLSIYEKNPRAEMTLG